MKIEIADLKMSYARLDELAIMQGELKSLSKKSFEKLCNSIIENKFCSPFHIWIDDSGRKNVLDGTQRLRALMKMKESGYELPEKFPIIEVTAKSQKDAAKKLIGLASTYGRITDESVSDFVIDFDLDAGFVGSVLDFPSVSFGESEPMVCPKCGHEFQE